MAGEKKIFQGGLCQAARNTKARLLAQFHKDGTVDEPEHKKITDGIQKIIDDYEEE